MKIELNEKSNVSNWVIDIITTKDKCAEELFDLFKDTKIYDFNYRKLGNMLDTHYFEVRCCWGSNLEVIGKILQKHDENYDT